MVLSADPADAQSGDLQADRQTVSQTDRQTDRQAGRQTDRKTDRQTVRSICSEEQKASLLAAATSQALAACMQRYLIITAN